MLWSFDESKKSLDMLTKMIAFLVPEYIKEGRNQSVIAVGCTGGHHSKRDAGRGII